jgi:hypothetical protein
MCRAVESQINLYCDTAAQRRALLTSVAATDSSSSSSTSPPRLTTSPFELYSLVLAPQYVHHRAAADIRSLALAATTHVALNCHTSEKIWCLNVKNPPALRHRYSNA